MSEAQALNGAATPLAVWSAVGFGDELVPVCGPKHACASPGKRPHLPKWQTAKISLSDFTPGGNLGLRTRSFPAIDADVDDAQIVAVVEEVAREIFGATARRSRSNSARCALLYRLEGEPFEKTRIVFATPNGTPAKIEILGEGQQLVVAGIHASGAPLQWRDPQPSAAKLAPMSAETRADFLAAVRVALIAAGCRALESEREEPRPKPVNGTPAPTGSAKERAYALATVKRSVKAIDEAPEGSRNDVLNEKAYALAQLVAGGLLDRPTMESAVTAAGKRCGLTDREIAATVASAFGAGESSPRGLPQAPGASPAPVPAGPLFLPVADFFAICNEHVEYIIEPYLPKDGFLIVAGPPKNGKTWFLAWLAGVIAALGFTVMFVEEEGAKETLRERLQPFTAPGSRIHVSHRKGWKLDNDHSVNRLIEEAKAAGAHVIILDPLNQLHVQRKIGDVPAEVIQAIQRIIRETGCAIILAHHTRKGESWNKASEEEAQSIDIAGSFAWAASADNIISIRAVPNAERRRGEVRFLVENPDTRNGEPFEKKLAVVTPGAYQKDALTWAQSESADVRTLGILLPLIPHLPETVTVAQLRTQAGIGMPKVRAAVKLGLQTEQILRKIGDKGGLYRVQN